MALLIPFRAFCLHPRVLLVVGIGHHSVTTPRQEKDGTIEMNVGFGADRGVSSVSYKFAQNMVGHFDRARTDIAAHEVRSPNHVLRFSNKLIGGMILRQEAF